MFQSWKIFLKGLKVIPVSLKYFHLHDRMKNGKSGKVLCCYGRKRKKKQEVDKKFEKEKKSTTRGIPRWSPNQVLTSPQKA